MIRHPVLKVALAAGVICFVVYLRALGCDFVNWDDQDYILNNVAIRSLDRALLSWAFTDYTVAWWMPLTWISLAIDYHFWGLQPLGYHLTNILLHAVNAALLVVTADRLYKACFPESELAGWPKHLYPAMLLLAGLMFGLHPLRVESVAWATERKDVLNGLFTFGVFIAYLRYVAMCSAPEGKRKAKRAYILSVLLFACSLMAKQTSVLLPLMLLVMDWFPLGRLRKGAMLPLLVEKIPFLILSMAVSLFTIYIGLHNNVLPLGLTVAQRLLISGNALFEYGRLMLFPVGVIPLYIIPTPIPASYLPKAIIAAGVCLAGLMAAKKTRGVPAALISFLLPLLPVLAITQNGIQSFAVRFTYLASIGPTIFAAGLCAALYARGGQLSRQLRPAIVCLAGVLLLFYAGVTLRLIDVWKDSGTMWTRVIAFQPFDRAYFYRGLHHVDVGNYQAAIADYTNALHLATMDGMPEVFNVYAFRAEAYARAGRFEEAVRDLTAAISMKPSPLYYFHRAQAFRSLGRPKEAEEDMRRAGGAGGMMLWISK